MGWKYDPKDAVECLPAGEYDAELTSVEEKLSKSSGNPMLEVVWTVMQNGRQWTVRDYIVSPHGLFKLKQIARAWGMLDEFNAGEFDLAACRGRVAKVELTVQEQDGYADKNQIKSVKAPALMPTVSSEPPATAPTADEEIPF